MEFLKVIMYRFHKKPKKYIRIFTEENMRTDKAKFPC